MTSFSFTHILLIILQGLLCFSYVSKFLQPLPLPKTTLVSFEIYTDSSCGGPNDDGSCSHMFNTWSLVLGKTVWEGLGSMVLVEEVCLWGLAFRF